MTMKFAMTRDINGYNGFGLKQSDKKNGVTLVQNVEQNIDVPTDSAKMIAIFTYNPGAAVFVSINDTAAAFTGILGSVTSELNPVAREVKSGDNISVITQDATANVGILYYAI